MSERVRRPLLVHHHVPKTGGTTLVRQILSEWYGDRLLNISGTAGSARKVRQMWRDADPEEWTPYDAITGHDILDAGQQSERKKIRVSIIRDPIDRCVSRWYHHIERGEPTGGMERHFKRFDRDVIKYIENTPLYYESLTPFLKLYMHHRYITAAKTVTGPEAFTAAFPDIWNDMETQALKMIDNLSMIMLTSRFDESVRRLASLVGKPIPRAIENQRSGNIPQDVRDRLETARPNLIKQQSKAYNLYNGLVTRFDAEASKFPNMDTP